MRRIALAASYLLAVSATGCLSDPEGRSCADLPPETPGCGQPDEGPRPDGGRDVDVPDGDASPDGAMVDVDRGTDVGPRPDEGVIDEDAGVTPDMGACEPGTDEACGSDVGACQAGRRFCNAMGQYEACLGAVGPTDEVCDGVDNDCDGDTDEGCDCVDGDRQPCGSDVGACMPGEQQCVDGAWSACEGAVDGAAETCDAVDNDCDGTIDNVPAVVEGIVCTVGVGQCRTSGRFTCDGSNDGTPVCDARPGSVSDELCNGLDDDCDGSSDEAIDPLRRILYSGLGQADPARPVVAPYGEFHGVAWLEDGRVYFGLALGSDWEIAPAEVGNFNGDDLIADGVALAGNPGSGFRLAVSYDGLGEGVTTLHLDAGGRETASRDIDESSTDGIDIVWQPRFGYAVAMEQPDAGLGTIDIGIEVVSDDGAPQQRYTVVGGQSALRRPSVALVDGVVAVAAVRTEVRSARGDVIFARFDAAGNPVRSVVLTETGTADNPDLIYVPTLRKYALAWDEVDGLARDLRRVRVAIISLAGEVEELVTLPAATDAVMPSVMWVPTREGAARLAVTWSRSSAQGFQIELAWFIQVARGWFVSPSTDRLFGEQGFTDGARAAYASEGEGIGAVFTYDDTRSRQVVLVSAPRACPQQP